MPRSTKDADVKLNLKTTADKNKKTLIRAIYRYGSPSKRLVYTTKRKIEPKHWDLKKQLPRSTYIDYRNLKSDLDKITNAIREIGSTDKGQLYTLDQFRLELDKSLGRIKDDKDKTTLVESWKGYIQRVKDNPEMHNRTAQKFQSSLNHVVNYFNHINQVPSWDRITWEFHDDFKNYLYRTHDHSINTVGKVIANIQLVMREGLKRKHHANTIMNEKGWRLKTAKTKNKIRLTEPEISIIYNKRYPTKRMRKVVDMAVVGCYTGLRYSDWISVTKDRIKTIDGIDFLTLMSYKTKEPLSIPVLPELQVILDKYNYKLPQFTDVEFNRVLKDALKISLPDTTYHRIYNDKGVNKSEQAFKYDHASTHACRRSFASNFYEMGFSPNLLRHITGHASEGQFLEYVDVDANKMAIKFAKEVMAKRNSAKVLSISKTA